MSKAWNDMKRAKEESYFDRKNREALERLNQKNESEEKPRISPVSGKEMEQVVLNGVVIDRCPESGGIWLDAGELEELIEAAKEKENESGIAEFLKGLAGLK